MKPLKLRKLLEFKDRDQVRSLLGVASGFSDERKIAEILMGYITNSKWALHGFYEGAVLKGLIGLELVDKKNAKIQYIAVRPDFQGTGLGRQLVTMISEKLKLKSIAVEADDSSKGFFEKLEFELLESVDGSAGSKVFKFSKTF